ncbi:MAG: SGNH/GDSL hydrolase family protein [Chloroflexota bacterium]|nr:SGNH/GDSL hydrolase family protein [Chloroflexota bacterium]
MKEILCYGDSNTWGYDPRNGGRYPRDVRWTGVLQAELGRGYHVIEEGLNGRTTVWEDPIEGYKSGKAYLTPCLETHKPLDLVIIMLGTNDLKHRFSLTAFDIAAGAGTLVDMVKSSQAGRDDAPPQVLLIVPPRLGRLTIFGDMFRDGRQKSEALLTHYRAVAEERACHLLDAGEIVESSEVDGVHLEPEGHHALGLAVAEKVREILP